MIEKHRVEAENAFLIWGWIQTRGGLFLWKSIDLSDLDKSWTGPVTNEDGSPKTKPHWKSADSPYRVITDDSEVVVDTPQEVKRFHVAIRPGSQGLTLKCTDGATRRIRKEVSKAGDNEWYAFDYGTQEAVIYVPGETVSLKSFVLAHLGDF